MFQDFSPTLIKETWSTAENTVNNYAAICVLPVVQTFEKPIHVVDTLACKTLDKVEETLPIVTKTPDEVKISRLYCCYLYVYYIFLLDYDKHSHVCQ